MELSAEDIADFRASARSAFAGPGGTLARTRESMATVEGYDRGEWRRLASDLDLVGMTLRTDEGGSGLTLEALGYAFEEAGYTSACLPLLSTAALALPLLQAVGATEFLREVGPRLTLGELTATLALAEDDGDWDVASIRTRAERDGSGWRLTGVKSFVVDGLTADLILVVARDDEGVGVYVVEHDAITAQPLVTMDQTRKMARIELSAVSARRLGEGDANSAIEDATAAARALLASEQVGGAQRCLDVTVEYARTRIQFGRQIGSFQALKQRLADVLIQVESARSAAYAALRACGEDDPARTSISLVASLIASEAFEFAAAQMIQLHGGIGFTWDHDAHIFFKRARASAQLLGSPHDQVERLAEYVLAQLD